MKEKKVRFIVTFVFAFVLCAFSLFPSVLAETIAVKSVTIEKHSKGYSASWDRVDSDYVDGYEVQASPERLFLRVKSFTVSKLDTSVKTVLPAKFSTCYVRVRPYSNNSASRIYYEWTYSENMLNDTRRPVFEYYMDGADKLSLRKMAGQEVGSTDTVQGACTDGTYAYHVMNDRNTGNAVIVKTELDTGKLVATSDKMKLGHASDMTYDSKNKRIIAVNTFSSRFDFTEIDAKTLKEKKTFRVEIPTSLIGASPKQMETITGFSGIAYNRDRNQYVLALLGRQDVIIADSRFKPVSYLELQYKKQGVTFGQGYNSQGIECTKDFILRSRSLGGNNLIAVYDYSGRFLSGLDISDKYEVENLYLYKKKLYADFYHSWQETKEKTIKKKVYMTPLTVTQLSPKVKGRIVKVRWKKTQYAQKYQVWVKKGKNGQYFCLKTTTAASFTFRGNKKTNYHIRVRAVNGLIPGQFSNLKTAKTGKKNYRFKKVREPKRKMVYKIVTETSQYFEVHRENYITRFKTL